MWIFSKAFAKYLIFTIAAPSAILNVITAAQSLIVLVPNSSIQERRSDFVFV